MIKKKATAIKPLPRVNYSVMFWLFFFGSIIGFVLEGLWQIIKKGQWENHSSTILGPFCIIYGLAAALLYLVAMKMEKSNLLVLFVVFAILGSALEFVASLFQEIVFGSVSWNYKKQLFNIAGRVSLKMTVIWGSLGVAFVKLIYPLFNLMLSRMQGPVWNFICTILTVFMVFNLLVTSVAVLRWGERVTEGSEPSNSVEAFLDESYDDETMTAMFSNMKLIIQI